MLPSTFSISRYNYYAFNAGLTAGAGLVGGLQAGIRSGSVKSGLAGAVFGISLWTITTLTRPIFEILLSKIPYSFARKAQAHDVAFVPAFGIGLITAPFVTQGVSLIFRHSFSATQFIKSHYAISALYRTALNHLTIATLVIGVTGITIGWAARAYFHHEHSLHIHKEDQIVKDVSRGSVTIE
jgi:hypothetical protein